MTCLHFLPILTVSLGKTRKCCAERGQQQERVFLCECVVRVGKRKHASSLPHMEE